MEWNHDLHRQLVATIRYKLTIRGWTAQDLAERTGYSVATIYRLFNLRKKPSEDCAWVICRELGIDFKRFSGIWELEEGILDESKETGVGKGVSGSDKA